MSEWALVTESLPEKGENVIIFDGRKVGEGWIGITNAAGASPGFPLGSVIGFFCTPDSWGEKRCKPVAWQPLPKPPLI